MKTLIIDDEPLPAKHLAAMIQRNCFEISSTTICQSPIKALELVKENHFNLIFLDIEMPEMNGFEFLKTALLSSNTEVIFTTAYSDYAIEAFKANATHYILKPVIDDELIQAVRKAMHNQQLKGGGEALEAKAASSNTITVYDGEEYLILLKDEIVRLEADGSYTTIYSTSHNPILASKRIGHFEDKLSPKSFFRCHNSHLVNLKHISKVGKNKGAASNITLGNGDVIPVSSSKKEQLTRLLDL